MKNVNLIASLSVAMLGLAAMLITVAGCSPTATQTPAAATPDPVAALKEIIAAIGSNGHKYGYVDANLAYDVKKTDSLVSPYTAEVNFRSRPTTGQPMFKDNLQFHMIAKLAQQDGKWVIKDVERHLDPMSAEQQGYCGAMRRMGINIPDVARHSDGTPDKEIDAWWLAFGGK